MDSVRRKKRLVAFPFGGTREYRFKRGTLLLLIWCSLTVSASLDVDSRSNDLQNLETYAVNDQIPQGSRFLPTSTHYRITRNHRHRIATRDIWRPSMPEDLKRISSNQGTVPQLKRRYSSTHPWVSLYHQEHHHSTPVNSYNPPLTRESSQRYNLITISPAQRIPATNQMVTVLKTLPPPPVQNIQSKDFYKKTYGTQEGVKYLRGSYGPANLSQAKVNHGVDQELEEVRLANEHFLQMRKNGRCHVPVAEVVCVKDLYPSDTKEYLPRCTLLHRCGDKSGCCDSDTLKCVPKAIQEVALNFYMIPLSSRTPESHISNSVEKLLFENHTECECASVDHHYNPTQEYETSTATTTTTTTNEPVMDQKLQKDHNSQDIMSSHVKCRECPEPFCRREYADGRCSCDCFDKQKPCLKIKRGREPLHEVERRCVETGKCHIPDCEYGPYNYSTGRCPRRPDDLQKHGKNGHPKNFNNPHHRWAFFERD